MVLGSWPKLEHQKANLTFGSFEIAEIAVQVCIARVLSETINNKAGEYGEQSNTNPNTDGRVRTHSFRADSTVVARDKYSEYITGTRVEIPVERLSFDLFSRKKLKIYKYITDKTFTHPRGVLKMFSTWFRYGSMLMACAICW